MKCDVLCDVKCDVLCEVKCDVLCEVKCDVLCEVLQFPHFCNCVSDNADARNGSRTRTISSKREDAPVVGVYVQWVPTLVIGYCILTNEVAHLTHASTFIFKILFENCALNVS